MLKKLLCVCQHSACMHARFGMACLVFAQGVGRQVKNCEVAKNYFSFIIYKI